METCHAVHRAIATIAAGARLAMRSRARLAEEWRYWEGVAPTEAGRRANGLWRVHSDAVNTGLLNAWLPAEPVRLLLKTDLYDEAAGGGLYAPLTAHAHRVTGLDISLLVAQSARPRILGHPATCGDVRRLPFGDDMFDVVVSISTLDHFHTLEEVALSLDEIHRVLRHGGQLVLTMDNPGNPIVWLRNALPFPFLRRLGLVPYFVGATCGARRLQAMLRRAGFEEIAVRAVMHCPRWLAVPVCYAMQRTAGPKATRRLLQLLMAFERLASLPIRFLTGHFVAVKAVKK